MGSGMSQILPGLYIGNFKDARDTEQLSRNKVTHILSVHDSARPMMEGVKYLYPSSGLSSQNLTRHFKESIKFIHECRLQGEGCLVHCLAGVSRSVTLVIAYIMTVTDFGWEDALHTVRAGRSCANPNLGFQRQLQEFEKYEVHQYRQWLKEEYGENPLRDAEEAKSILVQPLDGLMLQGPNLRCPLTVQKAGIHERNMALDNCSCETLSNVTSKAYSYELMVFLCFMRSLLLNLDPAQENSHQQEIEVYIFKQCMGEALLCGDHSDKSLHPEGLSAGTAIQIKPNQTELEKPRFNGDAMLTFPLSGLVCHCMDVLSDFDVYLKHRCLGNGPLLDIW
ncbi:hypothetical protein STEG23_006368, partial [Scotinomys teguina]